PRIVGLGLVGLRPSLRTRPGTAENRNRLWGNSLLLFPDRPLLLDDLQSTSEFRPVLVTADFTSCAVDRSVRSAGSLARPGLLTALTSVLVLHAPGVPAPPPLRGTRTASRLGLRLVHSWCFCPDLVWEWNSSDSLCRWRPLHSVSSAPVLRFSAPVGIRVQPVLQRITGLIVRNYRMTHANHNDIFDNQDERVPVGNGHVQMMDRSVTRKNIMMKRMCTVHTPDALQEGSGHAAALPHLKYNSAINKVLFPMSMKYDKSLKANPVIKVTKELCEHTKPHT
ncbi:hypothetical protein BJV77DRAFT_968597, partial [Russula vinacea]